MRDRRREERRGNSYNFLCLDDLIYNRRREGNRYFRHHYNKEIN
jgi:hypothetical protein